MIASSSLGPNVVLPGTTVSGEADDGPGDALDAADFAFDLPPPPEHPTRRITTVITAPTPRHPRRSIGGDYGGEPSPVLDRGRGAGRDRRRVGLHRHHRESLGHLEQHRSQRAR